MKHVPCMRSNLKFFRKMRLVFACFVKLSDATKDLQVNSLTGVLFDPENDITVYDQLIDTEVKIILPSPQSYLTLMEDKMVNNSLRLN